MLSRNDLHSLLDHWVAEGKIRGIDRTFARFLEETTPEAPSSLLLFAALASLASGHGHSCIEIEETLKRWTPFLQETVTASASPSDAESGPESDLETVPGALHGADGPPAFDAVHVRDALERACSSGELDYPLLTDPAGSSPLALVTTPRPRLYLRRYYRCEQRIREFIHTAVADSPAPAAATVRGALSILFPGGDPRSDWSRIACALATRTRFSVVTGGPGSGKTTVVVRMLALFHALLGPQEVRLAAPTGKAAARLQESILGQLPHLPPEYQQALPQRVTTLHRLLRLGGTGRSPGYTRANPLPVDMVVIDEASMVDVEMMATLVEALPPEARLILLGDKDQLASVEAGAVLADTCIRAEEGHYNDETVQWIRDATGVEVPPSMRDVEQWTPLDQVITMLRFSHRFSPTGPIAAMADAIRRGDAAAIAEQAQSLAGRTTTSAADSSGPAETTSDEQDQLRVLTVDSTAGTVFRNLAEHHGEYLRFLASAAPETAKGESGATGDTGATPDAGAGPARDIQHDAGDDARATALLKHYSRFQILCAVREGPWGVLAVNEIVRATLADRGLIDRDSTWYPGRPVMVTRNDYRLGLMNGDVGITIERENGLWVAFEGVDGGTVRWVRPVRLSSVETVFAMTVHKSQGSEFDHVALVLPDREAPVLTRELIYTGITRARRRVTIVVKDPETLSAAARKTTGRTGGLAAMLYDQLSLHPLS